MGLPVAEASDLPETRQARIACDQARKAQRPYL